MRAGNGSGRGGAAKGAGTGGPAIPFTADSPTIVSAADTNSDPETQEYRTTQRRKNRERREKAWTALDAIVEDATHPAHFNAARETLNRLDGMPTQKAELSGADGGAIVQRIERVIIDPANRNSPGLPAAPGAKPV